MDTGYQSTAMKLLLAIMLLFLLVGGSVYAQAPPFPSNPTVGEEVIGPDGQVYRWDGVKWVRGAGVIASPTFSGTMTFPDASTYTAAGHNNVKSLGIGVAAPSTAGLLLAGVNNGNYSTAVQFMNIDPGPNAKTALYLVNATHSLSLEMLGSGNSSPDRAVLTTNAPTGLFFNTTGPLRLNGTPFGGTCPAGEFVSAISNGVTPTCAAPTGGGGPFLPENNPTYTGLMTGPQLTLTNAFGNPSALLLGMNSTNSLSGFLGGAVLYSGAHYNGTNWVFDTTQAVGLGLGYNVANDAVFYYNTGSQPNTFTPAIIATINNTGINLPSGETYKINGVPIGGGGLPVNNPTYTGLMTGPTLNLTNTTSSSLLFGSATTPAGSITAWGGDQLNIARGAHGVAGTGWVADATSASIATYEPSGTMGFYINTGLTVGSTFTPTEIGWFNGEGLNLVKALGIGVAAPSTAGSLLYGVSNGNYSTAIHLANNDPGAGARTSIYLNNATHYAAMEIYGTGNTAPDAQVFTTDATNGIVLNSAGGGPISFLVQPTGGAVAAINALGVGIGQVPGVHGYSLEITRNQNADTGINILNNDAGNRGSTSVYVYNGTSTGLFMQHGTGFVSTGIGQWKGIPNETVVGGDGAGGLTLQTVLDVPVRVAPNSVDVADFTNHGLMITNNCTVVGAPPCGVGIGTAPGVYGYPLEITRNHNADTAINIENTDPGTNSLTSLYLFNGTHSLKLQQAGTGTTFAGRPNGSSFVDTDAPELDIFTTVGDGSRPVNVFNGPFVSASFQQTANTKGLQLGGFSSFNGPYSSLHLGTAYFTSYDWSSLAISGAAYFDGSGNVIADGGAGAGTGYFEVNRLGGGVWYSGPVAPGAFVPYSEIMTWGASGIKPTHIENNQDYGLFGVTGGVPFQGSRDSFGELQSLSVNGSMTLNFAKPFTTNVTCTLTADGEPGTVWYTAGKSANSVQFICNAIAGGSVTPCNGAAHFVQYHCFGMGG